MKKNIIAAIDVGTTKVCTIIAETEAGAMPRILGVGITPSAGMQKGMVVNFNETQAAVRASVKKAEQVAGHKVESAFVGVTGRHISSVNNHGVVSITRNDRMVHSKDLKRVMQVARDIKVPSDREVLHIIPRTYAVDGQEGVRNPVGMHGARLDVETHMIMGSIASIQNLTKVIRSIGIEIEDLVLEPLASAESVLLPEERQDGVLIADIGGGTTDIAVFKNNSIYHTSVLPIAGYQVSRDISVGLDISYEIAEELKKKYGNVTPGQEETDNLVKEEGVSVPYSKLSEIVRVRVAELFHLILLELPRSDFSKLIPSGIVLTGGCSNLPGIAELGQEISRLPVRIGSPLALEGVSEVLDNPAYATSVGLLLWKGKEEGTQTWRPKSAFGSVFTKFFKIFG